jgi:hypothetical protein
MPIARSTFLPLLLGAAALAADLPRHAVSLTVRPVAIGESGDPTAPKSVTIEIEARRTVRGNPRVSVEWYFLARDAATKRPYVFDAARVDLSLQEGHPQRLSVTSNAPKDSTRKKKASATRRKEPDKLWGWVVLARSGNSIIACEGSLFEVKEWILKSLGDRTVERAPPVGSARTSGG